MSDSVPDERLYADVILPLATPAMTFSVPEHLAGELSEGSCVIVQLGARKYYTGVVRPDTRRPSCRREGQAGRTDGRRPSCGDVRAVEAMGLAGLLLYVSARAGDASGRASGAQVRRAFGSGGGRRKLLAPAGDFRRAASVGPQRGGFACRSRFAVEGPGAVPGDDRVSGADPARPISTTRNSCRVVC